MQTEIEGDKDIIIFISIRTTSLDLYKLLKVIAVLGCSEKLRNLENQLYCYITVLTFMKSKVKLIIELVKLVIKKITSLTNHILEQFCSENILTKSIPKSVSEIKWVKTTVTYLLPYNRLLSGTGIELLTLNGPEEPKIR